MKNEIIKKINDYYGYRAINRVRFRNTIIHDKVLTKKLTKERNNESQLRKQKKNFSQQKFFLNLVMKYQYPVKNHIMVLQS